MLMTHLKKYILITVLIILSTFIKHTSLKAQLTVNNSLTPTQLVQTVLLGSGVTASNITYNGVPIAIGDFNGSASNIGLPAGVILSSGNINNAVGPNNQGGASVGNGRPGDPDLDQILSPTFSYDATILEFDFIPTSDTVKFRYVFASEEYMEFVSPFPGGINDGFGFFISGPGITGTFSNSAKNIAIIPGTALPVTMFHLNLNSNSVYYFDNGNGFGSGTAPDGQTVQYDGFTVPMTAVTAVQCGQTYHIKIAIADGGDSSLDSGVFLEAGSFSSSGAVDVGPDIAVNLGCTKQLVAKNLNPTTVTWNSIFPGASGTYNGYLACTSGCLNNTVTGVAGAPPFVDYIVCGTTTGCTPSVACDTVRIAFNPPLTVSVTPQNPVLCGGQNSTTLTANVTGGSPPYQFLWNNVNPSQSITVGSGIYTVEVKDESGCPPILVTSTITSYSVAPTANAGADINVCSQNPTVMLNGVVSGANGGIWSGGNGTFSPNNINALSGVSYTPTPAELTAGFVDLTLTTTGTGTCAPVSDVVRINYFNFTESVNFTVGNVSCFGGNNGSATVNVIGTAPPYTYNWSTVPAQTLPSINNLTSGTYSVTITNGLGCKLTTSVDIIQPPPIALASEIQKVACGGGNTGSISIIPVGGNGPYTYQWSNGATTPSLFNLTAQTYTVTVTDVAGCFITNSYTVFESSSLSLSLNATDVKCFGGKDGSITSTINGGTAPYKYSWNTGASSPILSGVTAGSYTLTVTDANLCTVSATVIVNEPLALVSANITTTDVTCNGLTNGSATATGIGGSGGYTYLWSPGGQTTATINNLGQGTYTLLVGDQNGCSTTVFATVKEPAPFIVSFVSQKNVSCKNGNDGSVAANPIGGQPPYSYTWSNGDIVATISNLTAQNYTVTVSDAVGCSTTGNVTISEPPAFVNVSVSATDALCFGTATGSVSGLASGGTGPYNYVWMPGNLNGQNIVNLGVGTYTVIVSDINNCTATNSATINEPTEITLATSSISADCGVANGQASVVAAGGSGSYNYLWAPSGGTNPTANNLLSGPYTITVTDNSGCNVSKAINVNENSQSAVSIASINNVSCYGGSNGSINAGIAVVGTYTYAWTPTGGSTLTATGLPAGDYTITVTDSVGCKSLASATITEPDSITISTAVTNVTCFGATDGMIVPFVSGGTGAYSYQWLPGGITNDTLLNSASNTYTLQVTDANTCTNDAFIFIAQPAPIATIDSLLSNVNCKGGDDGSITITSSGGTPFYSYSWAPLQAFGTSLSSLSAGTYTVTTTDAMGCIAIDSFAITAPALDLTATATVSAPLCFGTSVGTAKINASGGTTNYNYTWTPAVSVNDTAFGLGAGTYAVLISDANNCQTNISFDVTESAALTGNLAIVPPSCGLSNGTIDAQITGGTAPYNYLWTPGTTTTSLLANVGPGNYSILITDASACSLTLSSSLSDSSAIISIDTVIHVSCYSGNDGQATIAISQGIAPFIINWTPSGGNALTATTLTTGTYTVSVIDDSGCEIIDSVTITEPPVLAVSTLAITDVLCFGGNSGSASVNVSGGTGPIYNYNWLPSGATAALATNLVAGTHSVTVTDANGCSQAISMVVNEPTPLLSVIDTTINPLCFGGFGSASVATTGGILPYSYLWPSSGETDVFADSLLAGSPSVIVTDANGCTSTSTALITEPSQVITIPGANDTLCPGQSTVLSATATGGAGNYYYAWQPLGAINGGTINISPTTDETYTVIAYDAIGCPGTTATVSAIVYVLDSSNIQAYGTTPICLGQSSSIYIETSGPTGPLTYQWNNGLGNGVGLYTVTPTQNITYVVTVNNTCGLSISDSVTIYITNPPIVDFVSDSLIVCAPGGLQFTDSSTVNNPNDPIASWLWDFGDGTTSTVQNPYHTYNQAGNYLVSLSIVTTDGCTNNNISTPLSITGIPAPNATFSMNSTNLMLPNDILILNNQTTGATSYSWSFGDGGTSTQTSPQYVYSMVGTFQVELIALAQNGCLDTAYAQVNVDADVIFPTVFTPNLDGPPGGAYNINDLSNDVFFPYTTGVIKYEIEIYNRWGELIFASNDINIGWDGYYKGMLCQEDVYVWKAYVQLNNGKEFNLVGNLTMLW